MGEQVNNKELLMVDKEHMIDVISETIAEYIVMTTNMDMAEAKGFKESMQVVINGEEKQDELASFGAMLMYNMFDED